MSKIMYVPWFLWLVVYVVTGLVNARLAWTVSRYIPPVYDTVPSCIKNHEHHEGTRYNSYYGKYASVSSSEEPSCYPVLHEGQSTPGEGPGWAALVFFTWPLCWVIFILGSSVYGAVKLITLGVTSENERILAEREAEKKLADADRALRKAQEN
jgi:hypothetical protein